VKRETDARKFYVVSIDVLQLQKEDKRKTVVRTNSHVVEQNLSLLVFSKIQSQAEYHTQTTDCNKAVYGSQ